MAWGKVNTREAETRGGTSPLFCWAWAELELWELSPNESLWKVPASSMSFFLRKKLTLLTFLSLGQSRPWEFLLWAHNSALAYDYFFRSNFTLGSTCELLKRTFTLNDSAVMTVPSWLCLHDCAFITVPSWRCRHGGAVMTVPSWRCHHDSAIVTVPKWPRACFQSFPLKMSNWISPKRKCGGGARSS